MTHLITWCSKVATHPEASHAFDDFTARTGLGALPGWLMRGLGVLFNGTVVVTARVTARLQTASGAIMTPREPPETIQQRLLEP